MAEVVTGDEGLNLKWKGVVNMIVSFNCTCGNDDVGKAVEYDGAVGYEAIICTACGRYSDSEGVHEKDTWSMEFIKAEGLTIL